MLLAWVTSTAYTQEFIQNFTGMYLEGWVTSTVQHHYRIVRAVTWGLCSFFFFFFPKHTRLRFNTEVNLHCVAHYLIRHCLTTSKATWHLQLGTENWKRRPSKKASCYQPTESNMNCGSLPVTFFFKTILVELLIYCQGCPLLHFQ